MRSTNDWVTRQLAEGFGGMHRVINGDAVGPLRLAPAEAGVDPGRALGGLSALDVRDAELARMLGPELAALALGEDPLSFPPPTGLLTDRTLRAPGDVDGRVSVDIKAQPGAGEALMRALEDIGLEDGARYGGHISGILPTDALAALPSIPGFASANVSGAVSSRSGAAQNQGDLALGADRLRSEFGLDGTGLTIGILSDSFDKSNGSIDYADDIASGDLPLGITILDDSEPFGSDEGRAMAQLIHDIAPGAELMFHTAFGGIADFANGILELAAAGADIIVDDVIYFREPMFQDGPIARAIDEVNAEGVAYFSSAGNSARNSYEAAFRPVTGAVDGQTGTYHDFDPGTGTDIVQNFNLGAGESVILSIQWDDPYFDGETGSPGASNDIDVHLVDGTGVIEVSSTRSNVGSDPYEQILFTNTGSFASFGVAFELVSGQAPGLIKYVDLQGGTEGAEHRTESGTSYGHASAEGGLGVGAAFYAQTPPYGVNSPILQDFSSAGGFPILFEDDGTRLATPETRLRVDIVAPDGGDTTFFGSDNNDSGFFPNFFGTSAAAPNAAALMWEAVPGANADQIYQAMRDGAVDMLYRQGSENLAFGVDDDSGHGLVQAGAALAALYEIVEDAFEENDTRAAAADISDREDDVVSAALLDEDWFRIDLAEAGTLTVDLSFAHEDGNVDLRLTDASGQLLAESLSATDDERARLEIDGARSVFARVTGAETGTAYTLEWGFLAAGEVPVPPDRNADGTSDFLWQRADGTVRGILTGGEAQTLSSVGPGWRVADVADISGDGAPDLVWRNDLNGVVYIWQLDGNAIGAQRGFGEVGLDWHIAATPDLDGDGRDDLLWRSDDGALFLWRMDGTQILSTQSLGGLSPSWHLFGAPDFDGDGKGDLLWRNDDGTVYVWRMDGGTIAGQRGLGQISRDWSILDTPDLDGDGGADILWRNDAGALFVWLMDGERIETARSLGTLSTVWDFVESADFDGDGAGDLLWRNLATDQLYLWLMDGAAIAGQGGIGSLGPGEILDTLDTNGDGRADLQLRDPATGALTSREIDGVTVLGETPIGTIPAGATYLTAGSGLWDDGFDF